MSASNTLPITLQMGALPPAVAWTPQQLAQAIADRLSLVTSTSFALFVTGSTAPTSNVGPWLKDGNTWYVWSDAEGGYVPQTLTAESLGYWIGPDAPDHNVFSVWISTDVAGSPLAVNIYYNGAWTDVYASLISGYMTVVAFNAAIASYSTTAQMTAAIAAALVPYSTSAAVTAEIAAALVPYATLASPALTGNPTAPTQSAGNNSTRLATTAFVTAAIAAIPPPSSFTSSPAKAVLAGTQTVAIDAAPHKLLFASEVFDPNSVYDGANSKYVAPATGYYQVFVELQVDNNGGTASGMEIELHVYVNGVAVHTQGLSVASPPGSRWYPVITALVQATSAQDIEIYMEATDGVDAGNLDVAAASSFSVNRVPQS